jgi:small subunit ribosomal protein S16
MLWQLSPRSELAPLANLRHNKCLSQPRRTLPEQGHFSVLMIRLARFGARKQPYYRVVVIEKERARNGRPVEVVGTYNPRTNPASIDLKRERVDYWVSKGAQMSERVGKLYSKPAAAPAASVA